MALLHYWNLEDHRPDILMDRVFRGLGMFYELLKRTREYLESDAAVRRLAWDPGEPPANNGNGAGQGETGAWIKLTEPRDRPNEPDATFGTFLDENVKEVYETEPPAEREATDGRRGGPLDFGEERRIAVTDRDPENYQLGLEREPKLPELVIRPNTWPITCQIRALQALQNSPSSTHRPLLRLFEGFDHARWPDVDPEPIGASDWMVLTDQNRPGTDEQRRFVGQALGTPDFAFLEGPPGSGKTTAICELVLQLAKRGKRVLLCASTHVAVDNVLERLMIESNESNPHRDLVIPVRIGDRRNVSDKARRWQLERFVRTERERLLRELGELGRRGSLTPSQEALLEALRAGPSAIERVVLDAANLVCGTTIGILQHPDVKSGGHASPDFDVLIVDEASKTTFQEFLVPALLAKRWVIVGDPKQLSPYVDDDEMAVNVEACLPDGPIRDACIDAFLAGHSNPRRRRAAVVVAEDEPTRKAYRKQCAGRDVILADADRDDHGLPTADIVIGTAAALERRADELPLDLATVRGPENALHVVHRRADALRPAGQGREELPEWASEMGWRLARSYDLRLAGKSDNSSGNRPTTAEHLCQEVDRLLPVPGTGSDPERVWQAIDRVRRVAFPSILESLRHGFERDQRQRTGSALSDGLPCHVLKPRHVLLGRQHRMHPEIAVFSREHVYEGAALQTPEDMADKRSWSYTRAHRAVWRDVRGHFDRGFNRNEDEARSVVEELRPFDEWAQANPRADREDPQTGSGRSPAGRDGRPWEAAVLTFYRGQEREVRHHLREWTGQKHAMRHFTRGQKDRPYLCVELCTVDRFQGHEADIVLISFANCRATSFLESPNRLNVALTRARYQRVVIGDRQAMLRARGTLLEKLAGSEPWDTHIERKQQ